MSIPEVTEGAVPGARDASAGLAPSPRGRATWSGLLRLSLVSVPVKAYPAVVSRADSHFHQLHAGCGQRIRYAKHCPVHGPVDAGGIVSGFSVAPDQDVVVEEAELEALRPARDRALLLEHCLDAGAVDPVLFAGRTLYLLPDGPAAQQPYLVLPRPRCPTKLLSGSTSPPGFRPEPSGTSASSTACSSESGPASWPARSVSRRDGSRSCGASSPRTGSASGSRRSRSSVQTNGSDRLLDGRLPAFLSRPGFSREQH